jgi:hypothetical protein
MKREGVSRHIFEVISDDPELGLLVIERTVGRALQYAAGANRGALKLRLSAVHESV